jgi:hypothetical protein
MANDDEAENGLSAVMRGILSVDPDFQKKQAARLQEERMMSGEVPADLSFIARQIQRLEHGLAPLSNLNDIRNDLRALNDNLEQMRSSLNRSLVRIGIYLTAFATALIVGWLWRLLS